MDGLLIIDKPAGMTSHDVINRVRRILGTRRVGHTGTLDPFATGVMAVVVGKATRLAQFLDKDEKEYEAVVSFGHETDTGDVTGERKAGGGRQKAEIEEIIASSDWDAVFENFRGEIEQVPPMYSAKKVEGKKLYEHARKGREIERQPAKVTIRTLELIGPELRARHSALRIRVLCSAGTYIRTLAEDIGREIGTGAHLAELRRTRSGRFGLDEAITLDELAALDEPAMRLLPLEVAVEHLPAIELNADRAERTLDGLPTRVEQHFADGEALRMLGPGGELLAIGVYKADENSVRPKVVLG